MHIVVHFFSFIKKQNYNLRVSYYIDFSIRHWPWTKISKYHLGTNLSKLLLRPTQLLAQFGDPDWQAFFFLRQGSTILARAYLTDDAVQPVDSNSWLFRSRHHPGNSRDHRIKNIQNGEGFQLFHSFVPSSLPNHRSTPKMSLSLAKTRLKKTIYSSGMLGKSAKRGWPLQHS